MMYGRKGVKKVLTKSYFFPAANSDPVGEEDLEGEDGPDHPERRRPLHGGGEAHFRVALVQGHDLQVDAQVC